MKRTITYAGALPRSADFLGSQQNTMVALGSIISAAFGTGTIVDGLAVAPTTPPSMSISVSPGLITQLSALEATPYGSLQADTTDTIMKMGINVSSKAVGPIAAPATPGQGQAFLLQAQFVEADDPASLMVLPYFNSANPQQAYSGPGNQGISQYTVRNQSVALGLKAGVPATIGTQVWPTVDPGWVPLAVITVNYGQTQITNTSIAAHPSAPTIPARLGTLSPGFSRMATFLVPGTFSWVVPNAVSKCKVHVTGAGAGSAGATPSGGTDFLSSGGGGAGGTAIGIYNVVPGQTLTIVVGAGGTAGAASNGNGGAGGSSSFSTFCSATGGSPGTWLSASSSPGGVGGFAVGGLINVNGGYGGDGTATGGSVGVVPGYGGASFWGGGQRASVASSITQGGAIGSGGGGVYSIAGSGNSGQAGCVVVEY